jgi:hypothetical protein
MGRARSTHGIDSKFFVWKSQCQNYFSDIVGDGQQYKHKFNA